MLNSRRTSVVLGVGLGIAYVFAFVPLSLVATRIWTAAAHGLFSAGWVSPKSFLFVITMLGELSTFLCVALPFGVVLGLVARRSILWGCLSFIVAASITELLSLIYAPPKLFSDLSAIDQIVLVAASQDFWLFPLAIATVAVGIWRWRSRDSVEFRVAA